MEIIKEFALACQSQPANLEHLLKDLPVIFQLSYPEALKLKVNLQNKGVTLLLEEGEEIPFQAKDKEEKDTGKGQKNRPEHSETIYSKITFEQVLKDMDSRSSISQELLGNTLSRRKDLFMIILIAFIPFLSLNLESQYQLLFFSHISRNAMGFYYILFLWGWKCSG